MGGGWWVVGGGWWVGGGGTGAAAAVALEAPRHEGLPTALGKGAQVAVGELLAAAYLVRVRVRVRVRFRAVAVGELIGAAHVRDGFEHEVALRPIEYPYIPICLYPCLPIPNLRDGLEHKVAPLRSHRAVGDTRVVDHRRLDGGRGRDRDIGLDKDRDRDRGIGIGTRIGFGLEWLVIEAWGHMALPRDRDRDRDRGRDRDRDI